MTLSHFLFLRQFCEPDLCGILLANSADRRVFFRGPLAPGFGHSCCKQEMVFLDLLQKVHSKKEVGREKEQHPSRALSRFKEGSVSDVRIVATSSGRCLLHEANGHWASSGFGAIIKSSLACMTCARDLKAETSEETDCPCSHARRY